MLITQFNQLLCHIVSSPTKSLLTLDWQLGPTCWSLWGKDLFFSTGQSAELIHTIAKHKASNAEAGNLFLVVENAHIEQNIKALEVASFLSLFNF